MRVVLPYWQIPIMVGGLVLLFDAWEILLHLGNIRPDPEPFSRLRLAPLCLFAFAYGAYRALGFHPVANTDYRRWLELTPWTPNRPLPAGPISLVPQDAVVLLLLLALFHEVSPLALAIPIGFLIGYLPFNALLTAATGEWVTPYLVAFGLTSLPLGHHNPVYLLLIAVACIPIATWGTWRSLQRFPWVNSADFGAQSFKNSSNSKEADVLGWPVELLAPKPPKRWIPLRDGVCGSLLCGWLEFTLGTMYLQLDKPPGELSIACVFPAVFALATIPGCYINYASPIDFWGRIRTFRWLIPRHDIIWLAPISGAIIAILAHTTLRIEISAIGTATTMFLITVVAPHVENWRLTGAHRIRFIPNAGQYVQSQ